MTAQTTLSIRYICGGFWKNKKEQSVDRLGGIVSTRSCI